MVTPSGLVLLTDRRLAGGSLQEVVAAAVRGGATWVVLRERDLPYAERHALAEALRELLPPGRLIVAGPDPLGADAVHLAETDPFPAVPVALTGRSCHARPAPDADHAPPPARVDFAGPAPVGVDLAAPSIGADIVPPPSVGVDFVTRPSVGGDLVTRPSVGGDFVTRPSVGVDYVTLSPIYPTLTKPGYGPAIGAEGAAALAGDMPWLALGGIDSPERAAACAAAGARGIAVLGAVMRASDPEAVCRALAEAFDAARTVFDASSTAFKAARTACGAGRTAVALGGRASPVSGASTSAELLRATVERDRREAIFKETGPSSAGEGPLSLKMAPPAGAAVARRIREGHSPDGLSACAEQGRLAGVSERAETGSAGASARVQRVPAGGASGYAELGPAGGASGYAELGLAFRVVEGR